MKRHASRASAIVLGLAFPLSASANAWLTLQIVALPVLLWYIGIISILMETAVLWFFLKARAGKALLMSFTANAISLLVGLFWTDWVFYLDQASADSFPIVGAIFGSWHASLILMFLITISTEWIMLKIFWQYRWRQLRYPVIIMNILTYLIIEVHFLWDSGIFR